MMCRLGDEGVALHAVDWLAKTIALRSLVFLQWAGT